MGLPVAELSEGKPLASGAGSLLLSSNNTEERVIERSQGNTSAGEAEKDPTMDVGAAKSEDTRSLVEATDANGPQTDSAIVKIDDSSEKNNPSSPVPLAGYDQTDHALGEEPSTDLGDVSFITSVPVIQNLADVVEVMSVVTNDSEPPHQEPQPPAPDATGLSQTMSADHVKDESEAPVDAAATTYPVVAESTDPLEGHGAQETKVAPVGSNIEAGPDIESLLPGSSLIAMLPGIGTGNIFCV